MERTCDELDKIVYCSTRETTDIQGFADNKRESGRHDGCAGGEEAEWSVFVSVCVVMCSGSLVVVFVCR